MSEVNWYVVHTYSDYENKVKANIEKTIENRHLEDQILEVRVPMEEVVEVKNGTKKQVLRKLFPGYVLINMIMNDDTWYVVRLFEYSLRISRTISSVLRSPNPFSIRGIKHSSQFSIYFFISFYSLLFLYNSIYCCMPLGSANIPVFVSTVFYIFVPFKIFRNSSANCTPHSRCPNTAEIFKIN